VFSASYYNQERVSAGDREISQFPVPNGSLAFRQQPRLERPLHVLRSARHADLHRPGSRLDLATNVGAGTLFYDPTNPTGGASTFHRFGLADRFNFAPYNLVLTPSERKAIFTSLRYNLSDDTSWYIKGLYNKRESKNQAAPEPIVLGPDNGTGTLSDRIVISRLNPFNPFGIDLDPNVNFYNLGRRPVEGGPRIFVQDVDTYYFGTGSKATSASWDRPWSWDLNFSKSESKAEQQFFNGYNLRRMQIALGDPAICAANPGCTPLNCSAAAGTITQPMLDWIRFTTKDSGKQELTTFSGNITGDLFEMPAGPLGFAAGAEYRDYSGSFTPDQARIAGESQDSAAGRDQGQLRREGDLRRGQHPDRGRRRVREEARPEPRRALLGLQHVRR
jgi:iron complex outermembrane receptor protein